MKLLVVGGGGREHALGHALARSPQRPALVFAPGNPGTAALGTNVPDVRADDVPALVALARREAVDAVVVGPETPLVLGLADALRAAGIPCAGPDAYAAQLEGSKAFAKAFMDRYGIPTAAFRTFGRDEATAAAAFIAERAASGANVVVKASGLAAGKGVVVADTPEEALDALRSAFDGAFGEAGHEIVVEERMEGPEASLFVLTDGTTYALLPPAQDHKRLLDGDRGPNTGGMGAYAPAPVLDGRTLTEVCRTVVEPTLRGLQVEGHPFVGCLYVGLMLTPEGPRVVEYNVRLGDPEAQAVLPLVSADVAAVVLGLASGRLASVRVTASDRHAATVVLASEGYPGRSPLGRPITGIEEAEALEGVTVFHAGTARDDEGRLVTAGGRVLAVTAVAPTLEAAVARVYEAADRIAFEGKQLRRDIAHRALARPVEA